MVASGDHDEPIDSQRFVGRVGVAARVHERINLPGDTVQITLQGLRRIVVEGIDAGRSRIPIASIRAAKETPADPAELDDLVARVVSAAETLAELVDRIPDEVPAILKMNVSDPGRFADLAATNMNFRISDKDEVLQRLDVGQRLRFILNRLEREVARARVMEDVKRQTEIKIEQHQREFYLRQQLRAIQAELGEADPGEKEAVELLKKIDDAKLPEKVGQEARRETERLRHAVARIERVSGHPHVPRLDPRAAVEQARRATRRSRSRRSRKRSTTRHYGLERGEGAHHRVSRRAQAARRRSARPDSLLRRTAGHGQDLARRSDRARRSGASSIASRWAACATRPRSADIAARTSARCRGCSSRRCAACR